MVFENCIQNFTLMLTLQVADPQIRTGASWGGLEGKDQNTDGKQSGSRKKRESDAVSYYRPLINNTTSRGTAGAWRVCRCILLRSALLLSLYIWSAAILFILLSLQDVIWHPACFRRVSTFLPHRR